MRKAVGITRVSQSGDREGESFISPVDQKDRMEEKCASIDLDLVDVIPEMNVSGGRPLRRRKGVLGGIEMIEAGEVDVLMVAYFDRLVREVRVQSEILSRVEAAGGEVLSVDFGRISEETAVEWLSANLIGTVHDYLRRSTKEKTEAAKANAIARGIPTWPDIPPGYKREVVGHDKAGRPRLGPFVPDPPKDKAMLEAFRMRGGELPGRDIEAFLRENGITWRRGNLAALFRNRVYLGELRFGKLVNLKAHEAIVPVDDFNRAQRAKVRRGRYAKSDYLLARLDVLRCDEGRRMSAWVQTQRGRRYPCYACPQDLCERPMVISAAIVEPIVRRAVEKALGDTAGRASVAEHAREAEDALRDVDERISAAIRAFAGVEDVEATQEVLGQLRAERAEKQEVVDQLGGAGDGIMVTAADLDTLTFEEWRDLIRAVVREVTISSGHGAERVSVELFV